MHYRMFLEGRYNGFIPSTILFIFKPLDPVHKVYNLSTLVVILQLTPYEANKSSSLLELARPLTGYQKSLATEHLEQLQSMFLRRNF